MNVKEAEKLFFIKKEEIYKLGKIGWSGVTKNGREWNVSDDTEVLLSVSDIRLFLYHLLRYKNNDGYVFPRKMCPDNNTLIAVINQQYGNGLIGNMAIGEDFETILKNVKLTEEAIELVIGKTQSMKFKSIAGVKVNINPSINIGLVNASANI